MSGGVAGDAGRSWRPRRAGWPRSPSARPIVASPALGRWLAATVEPLRRAGREGYAPTDAERRRLAVLGTVALAPRGVHGRRPGTGAVPGARRPRRRGLGAVAAAGRATGARSSAGCRRSRRRSPTRSPAGARCAPRSPPPRRSVEGPPAAELARVRADLELGASTAEALGRAPGAPALDAGRLVRRRAALPAARRRRPRRAAPALRGVRGRARPGRRRRPLGHRAGPVHRAARRRHADRRGAVRRADPAGLRRRRCSPTARRSPCWPSRPRSSWRGFAAIRRLSRIEDG